MANSPYRPVRLLLLCAVLSIELIGSWREALQEARDGLVGRTTPVAALLRANAHVEGKQEAELIPAIFARDPRVRFVYDRHVSKWM